MLLFIVALLACVPHAVRSIEDVCSGTGVRPILLIPGFQGTPLYDKERNYDIEWPDVDTFGLQFDFNPEPAAIDLPLEWDGLQQAPHRIGPERSDDDEYPGLDGLIGDIFEFAVYRQFKRIVQGWKHPKDASIQMYYTVSWDWRRDLWTEAPRILKALKKVHEITGCKVILAGHSFGGRMLYALLARYGREAADLTAGAIYAAAPFHGSVSYVASLSIDRDFAAGFARLPVDTLFTFPSVYTLGPAATAACFNADSLFSTNTFPCAPGKHPTGINCESSKCGRPVDWPEDKPFFLPLDLQDPDVWLRIGAAQPTLTDVSPQEELHLRRILQTAKRMSNVVSGPGAAAVQAIHPPAAVISLQLTDPELPAAPEPPADMINWWTCDPSDSFGQLNATEYWCNSLKRGGGVPGDGTLTDFMMELQGEGWKRSIHTFRMTKAPPRWPPLALNPHAAALMLAKNSFDTLVCADQKLPDPSCAGDVFPTLEEIICSIIYRADNPDKQYPVMDTCSKSDIATGLAPWLGGAADRVRTFFSFLGRQLSRDVEL